jgi:hypothetical protein
MWRSTARTVVDEVVAVTAAEALAVGFAAVEVSAGCWPGTGLADRVEDVRLLPLREAVQADAASAAIMPAAQIVRSNPCTPPPPLQTS